MIKLSKALRQALEAEEAGELNKLLGLRRKPDFETLRKLLSPDPDIPPDFRTKAMYALSRWGDTSVVPDIVQLLPNLNEIGRISALSALGHLGSPEATVEILKHTDDPSPQVRKAATLALSRIGTPEAAARLREIATKDPQPWIRELAARHNQ